MVLEGFFRDNQPSGHCKLTSKSGMVLEGQFKDGKPNGIGCKKAEGVRYNGSFVNGKF